MAGFQLDDMIGKYKDFARGYLFYARVHSPVSIQADHPYLVNSTKLPEQTIEALNTQWQGNQYNFGGVTTFGTLDITFKADLEQGLRQDFLRWMQKIHDPVTNIHGNPGEYFGSVGLTQLDTKGEAVMSYNLSNAFPTAITEIGLDYGTKEVSTFSVTFTYQYHTVESIFGGQTANAVELS
jgi:hypothetical protein